MPSPRWGSPYYSLARELISRTRVAARLAGYRDRPAADLGAVCTALLRLSDFVKDIPEIIDVDVNPLLADDAGGVALDARIRVERATRPGDERLAIRPYPNELEESISLDRRSVLLRPIRSEDRPQLEALFVRTETADMQLRFFCIRRQLPCHDLARYSQIDYDREMAFVALAQDERGEIEMLGDVRSVADPDNLRAEFTILVQSDVKGKGLGFALLAKLIRYFRGRGTKELVGEVIATNTRMRELARDIGSAVGPSGDPTTVTVRFDLQRKDSVTRSLRMQASPAAVQPTPADAAWPRQDAQDSVPAEPPMLRVLLPVDGSANAHRAAEHLIKIAKLLPSVEVLVLNVQPSLTYLELLLSRTQNLIEYWSQRAGKDAARSVCALLDAAGVAYTLHVEHGEPGETIEAFAQQRNCDLIVMGTPGMGASGNPMLGSIATNVIHAAAMPVTLVK